MSDGSLPDSDLIMSEWHSLGCPSMSELAKRLSELKFPISINSLKCRVQRAIAPSTIRQYRKDYADKQPRPPTFTPDEGGAVVSSADRRITSLEQLLAFCQVDLRYWEVERYIVNKWEVGAKEAGGQIAVAPLIQIKAWLIRREIRPFEAAFSDLLDGVRRSAPRRKPKKRRLPPDGLLLLPALYDTHFGKLAIDENWNVTRAAEVFVSTGARLLERAQAFGALSRIVFPIGNDIFHADNLFNTTTRGTWVQISDHLENIIRAARRAHEAIIELFADVAPVDIIPCRSNHDALQIYWLLNALDAYFHNDSRVSVDLDYRPRKYYKWGATLLGFEHGDAGKPSDLALTMATEAPEAWASTSWREWHRGHFHKRQNMLHHISEEKGVIVRTHPALCPPDKWHDLRRFIGNRRAGTGLLYHPEHGPVVEFQIPVV